MKTIEEADFYFRVEKGRENMADGLIYFTDRNMHDSFMAGAEFVQRWIPVEEELPEIGDEIIAKNEVIKVVRKISDIFDIKDITLFATHWRPIEYKFIH